MNNKDEYEIDLIDLMFYILKKWRPVLIIAVILAILMGGYKICRGVIKYQDKQYLADLQETYDTDLKNYHVTKEGYEKSINSLTQNIAYEEDYEKNSVLFQLDPYNKWVAKTDLFIRMAEEKDIFTMVDPVDSLVKAYSSILRSESTLEKASKENNIEVKYLRELINFEADYNGNMIMVSVTYKDGGGAQKILNTILESVKARQTELESNLGAHNIIFMSGETSVVADQDLANIKNKRVAGFSEMQKNMEEIQLSLDELDEPRAPTGQSLKEVLKSSAKYGAMGGVLGAFLTTFTLCIIYVINPSFRSSKEFNSRFNIKILGILSPEEINQSLTKIDTWLNKLEGKEYVSKEDVFKRIIANISIYTEKGQKILFTGTVEPDLLTNIEMEIKDKLPELSFEVGTDMNCNFDTLTRLPAVDGIILVEKCGVSKYKSIENQLETINNVGKKIIGCIIL